MLYHTVVIACVSSLIIILIYLLVYILERKQYIGIWILSWVCHLMKHVSMLFIVKGSKNYLLVTSNQLLALISTFLLLAGCSLYLKVKLNKKWKYIFALIGIWILASNYLKLPFVTIIIPTFTLLCIANIRNGFLFLRLEPYGDVIKNIVGFAFILLGIYSANYPFLREVEWIALYGYSLGVILEVVIAGSIVALHMHITRINLNKIQKELLDNIELQKQTISRLCQSEATSKKNVERFKALYNNMKNGEESLLESERQYKCLIEILPEPVIVHNKTGIIYANDAAVELLKVNQKNDLIGNGLVNFAHPDFKNMVENAIKQVIENSKKISSLEIKLLRLDGEVIVVETKGVPINYNREKAALIAIHDITDRKRAELGLRETNERLELAFEGTNDGLWDWSIIPDNCYSSPMYNEILGDNGEIPNSLEACLDRIHPQDREGMRNSINQYLNEKRPYFKSEFRIKVKDNELKWLLVRGKALWDNEGNPIRMVGSITDITERKNIETNLTSNLEEARSFQQKLLPVHLPHLAKVGIETSYKPANRVGGDIYDIIQLGSYLVVYIADVSGNGIPAAMMSTYLKAGLKHPILEHGEVNPAEVLNYIKDVVAGESLFEGRFVTLLVCCIDLDTLKIRYSNAGHCYPLVARNNEYIFLKNSEKLISEYYKNGNYSAFEYELEPLDRLLLYTDGIYEWKEDDIFFGLNSFKEYFALNGLSKKTLDVLVSKSFQGDDDDDVSYILIEFHKVFERKLPATSHNLGVMLDILFDEVKGLMKNRALTSRILQASTEMLMNAFKHGNNFDETKGVILDLRISMDFVKVNVRDEGNGFDWKSNLNSQCVPTDCLRGRGIYITNHYADEILYNDKGNEVTLKFVM